MGRTRTAVGRTNSRAGSHGSDTPQTPARDSQHTGHRKTGRAPHISRPEELAPAGPVVLVDETAAATSTANLSAGSAAAAPRDTRGLSGGPGSGSKLKAARDSAGSKCSDRTAKFYYDTPRSASWVDDNAPPTPDFDEPEKVIESNMTALKRCRHKLNVHQGGAKKFFLGWNTEHDGNLSRQEMFDGFNHLHLGFTPAQADFLVRAFDADMSNSVEYHEFCQTMEMSDDDILKTVGAMSVIKPPPWIKPKGWKFTPHEQEKIKKTQANIQERMHQTFGGNPRDIRDAFLYMDKQRSGVLNRDDFVKTFKRIGVEVKPADLNLLLASLDNEAQKHNIPYTNFVKNFESQPAGSFNPFFPTDRIPGTEVVTRDQLENTGAPKSVQRKWSDSYGRDPRYRSSVPLSRNAALTCVVPCFSRPDSWSCCFRVSFPEVYRAKLRPGSCPPDYSDNPDFELVDEWRQSGKTIGREISTLKANKPIPPQDSVRSLLLCCPIFTCAGGVL